MGNVKESVIPITVRNRIAFILAIYLYISADPGNFFPLQRFFFPWQERCEARSRRSEFDSVSGAYSNLRRFGDIIEVTEQT